MGAFRALIGIAAGAGLMLAAASAPAHHGWSSYDSDRPLTVSGTIERVSSGNPHVTIFVATTDGIWEVVLAPPSRMEARNADAAVVQVGKNIEAYGYPSREQAKEMRAERITIDGRTFEMR